MRFIYSGVVVLAVACSFLNAAPQVAPPGGNAHALLTADEAKEAKALIDALFTAGFPDTQKATVYSGKLGVSATFDPGKGHPPLPSFNSTTQMTVPNSTKMMYGYSFDGLHFKLADGSWIIALSYHFKPGKGDNVNAANATEVKLATLTADAGAAFPFDAEKNAGPWLEKVSPGQRERAKAELNRFAAVTRYLKLNPDLVAPALVLLQRAGWSDALDMSLTIADQRARNYWQLKPWSSPDPAFDPTGAYPNAKEEEEGWKKGHPQYISEPPQSALSRAMFRWCRAQIMVEEPEDAMLPLAAAVAATKACVDPKDPQKNLPRLDAMGAGAALPVTVAANAPLATRLQSWESRPRRPRISVSGGGGPKAPGGLSINTSIGAAPPSYIPQKADLDDLVALLADERPSRCNDFAGPRTLGDNAWRAVAALLKSDPRTLAGYPTDHPWTAAERKAAAAAVQKWWKEHRKEYVEK